MEPKKRILFLIFIMSLIVLVVEAITIGILYHTAIIEEKSRLVETVKSQARLIESVASFDRQYSNEYPNGAEQATLAQIRDAHSQYDGFGKTGEFTLSKKVDNNIVFLLRHRHGNLDRPKPIPWDSGLAQPMQLALLGKQGTIVGLDYRGVKVLAAYEPVAELDLGIVAKIDLSEVRAPFVKAALTSGLCAIIFICIGVILFFKVTNPILRKLHENVSQLEKALVEVKTLKGILPICSHCKQIRDDKGYWNQVESYVREHAGVEFTHSICPQCAEKHYPGFNNKS